MKVVIFLALLATCWAQLTTLQSFSTTFEYFSPTITGRLIGTIHYDYPSRRIRNIYEFAGGLVINELLNHNTDAQTGQVRHIWCPAACEAENLGTAMPFYFAQGGDTLAGNENVRDRFGATRTCTRYNRGGAIASISYDASGPCRIAFSNGAEYRFSPGPKDFNGAAFNGVPPANCPAKTCGIKIDMYQVLDESGSISSSQFTILKNFARDVVNGFRFDQVTGAGMGIVTFSSGSSADNSARVKSTLSFIQSNVRNVVINLVQAQGGTCIGCGADKAIRDRANNAGKRASATKVGLVVTDGENNAYTNLMNEFPVWRGNSAGNADFRNWIFFAIGVGSGINQAQLNNIAGTTARVSNTDFNNLQNLVSQIVSQTCVLDANGGSCPDCRGFCVPVLCQGRCLCPDCQDFNPCTLEFCNNAGVGCQYPRNPCNDNDACTIDSCADFVGCQNDPIVMFQGACRDVGVAEGVDNVCTTDGCRPASGCFHEEITCFDNNACTTDQCNPVSGCFYPSNGGNCEQCEQIANQPVDCSAIQAANLCFIIACDPTIVVPPEQYPAPNLQCKPLRNKTCDDGNACTIDTCNPTNGDCVFTPVNETIYCSDNNACTRDFCDTTTGCASVAWNCTDFDPCTDDLCDPNVLASFDNFYGVMKGCNHPATDCNDNNICTVDTCGGAGCENRPKDCSQDPKLSIIIGTCYQAECDPNLTNGGILTNEGCYLEKIINTTINECGLCCGNDLPREEYEKCIQNVNCPKISGTGSTYAVGGLFLAAILIAIIALCIVAGLLGGKKGYDIYLRNKVAMTGNNRNPLYTDAGLTGQNPLYDGQKS